MCESGQGRALGDIYTGRSGAQGTHTHLSPCIGPMHDTVPGLGSHRIHTRLQLLCTWATCRQNNKTHAECRGIRALFKKHAGAS